jgi:hypothetical protein
MGGRDDTFEVVQSHADGPDHWNSELRARDAQDLLLRVEKAADPRIWITNRMAVPPEVARIAFESPESRKGFSQVLTTIEEQRAGTLTGELKERDGTAAVEMRVVIYEDGFSRHVLNAAVLEIARFRRSLVRRFQTIIEAADRAARAKQLLKAQRQNYEQDRQEAPQPVFTPGTETLDARSPDIQDPTRSATARSRSATKWCLRCKSPLQPNAVACPFCGYGMTASNAPNMGGANWSEQRCPNQKCARTVRAGERFCSNCGTRVSEG